MYLYNSATHKKEEFKTHTPGRVEMYTCGPTVYHFAHIGNLRSYIMEDVLEKFLRWTGYDVHRVMNITDVGHLTSDADEGEDKMLKGAKREHKTVMEIAQFYTDEPELTKVVNKGGEEFFVLKVLVSNNSDYDGIIQMNVLQNGWWYQPMEDPRARKKVEIAAHTSKEFVSVWEEQIRDVEINTMVSGNLPYMIRQSIGNVKQERNKIVKDTIYTLPESSLEMPGEVIVDNEDSTLFVLSTPAVVGLLPKWLDKVEDTSFKYSGISWWRAPLQWTATTNAKYYGKYIRSAYVIKSGDGSQTATWKIPVPEAGQYELYYHVFKDDELRWNDRLQG